MRGLLDAAEPPLSAETVAHASKSRLSPKRRERLAEVLAILADLHLARADARLFAARG